MTADRTAPTTITDPGGIGGDTYAAEIAEEIEALWNGVITQTGTVTGTANAIAAVSSPPLIDDPIDGQTFRLIPTANNTLVVTINLDARGAIALKDEDGGALAAGDLVSGRAILFFYHDASGFYRLCNPTTAALIDALSAEIAANTHMELIGDTTITVAVAQIEHTFVANDYLEIISYAIGISGASTGTIDFTLRNVSGAIVTSSNSSAIAGNYNTLRANAFIDILSATKFHGAGLQGAQLSLGPAYLADSASGAVGSNATAPDRIRWAASAGNLDLGRVVTFGIRAPV